MYFAYLSRSISFLSTISILLSQRNHLTGKCSLLIFPLQKLTAILILTRILSEDMPHISNFRVISTRQISYKFGYYSSIPSKNSKKLQSFRIQFSFLEEEIHL